jgi:glycosyltransferase involved in cell wall biosynthesis
MDKVSILIPSYNELFMPETVNDIFIKATGEIEVIVVIEGSMPEKMPKDNPNLILLHNNPAKGMRSAINSAVKKASGKFLMKSDAHCLFSEGFDEVLKKDCEDNWVVIPSRYSLDVKNWKIEDNNKPRRDYHYLCFPDPNKGTDTGMHGVEWWERGRQRIEYDIDDEMSFQGSCWFMTKNHFDNNLHRLSEEGYGSFAQEAQEIGLKTWLGGGAVKVNKNTWYAHLHKGKAYGRMYPLSRNELIKHINWSARYWMNNEWKERIHNMDWFIEKFWPVPTWPENRNLWVAP